MQSTQQSLSLEKSNLEWIQILSGSLLIALFSQISIPLYFTPVPLSGQTLGVILIGVLLGGKAGALSVVAYLAEGAMGLPVFAMGRSGLQVLMGTNGGYFLGFILQAYISGWIVEKHPQSKTAIGLGLATACLVQLGLGALWLGSLMGWQFALSLGLYPFLLGESIKVALALVFLRFLM